MSPEQGDSDAAIDGRSDIYSLGCVLYEMLIGEPPFTGPSAQVIISRHMSETVPSLHVARPAIPPEVEAITLKALAKTPADRYQTGVDFASDLKAIETQSLRGMTLPFGVRIPGPGGPRPRLLATESRLRIRRFSQRWRRVTTVVLLLFVIGTAITIWRLGLLEPSPGYAVENPEKNFVVLPSWQTTMTAEEVELSDRTAEELTRLLNSWDELRAVDYGALPETRRKLGLEEPLKDTGERIRVAKEVLAGTLITVRAQILEGQARVTVQLYDVATGELDGQTFETEGAPRFDEQAGELAGQILGLRGAPEQLLSLHQETGSYQAALAVQNGERLLDRWNLDAAEDTFRAVLLADSMFARAHHYLAMTLYYQAAKDAHRIRSLAPEIRQRALKARNLSDVLLYRDSLHVAAFQAFVESQFDAARQSYRALIAQDDLDNHAWLMLGTVEYRDAALAPESTGEPVPRGDWNVALDAFARSIDISPDFYLGHASFLNILLASTQMVDFGCRAYWPPDVRLPSLGMEADTARHVTLCPVATEPLSWVELNRISGDERQRIDEANRSGGARLLQRTEAQLASWTAIAGDDPGPRELWISLVLARRSYLPADARPELADSLVALALDHALVLDGLLPDNPEAKMRLGSLHLAAGNLEEALRITEEGIELWRRERPGETTPPREAGNVFLATGRAGRAFEMILPAFEHSRSLLPDTVNGELLLAHQGPDVFRLQIYGALRWPGPEVRAAADRIYQNWIDLGYDERQLAFLKTELMPQIQTALALDDELLEWLVADLEDIPDIWSGFVTARSNPEQASRHLRRFVTQLDTVEVDWQKVYLAGSLAQRVGEDSLALDLFRLMNRRPPWVARDDDRWGIRSLSYLLVARSQMAVGDTASAIENYTEFLRLWENADPELQGYVEEAREVVTDAESISTKESETES
jgi:tetratricopeptide (TPR) repeat protein